MGEVGRLYVVGWRPFAPGTARQDTNTIAQTPELSIRSPWGPGDCGPNQPFVTLNMLECMALAQSPWMHTGPVNVFAMRAEMP